METILCSGHDKPCYLKTGVKEGPSFGRSFYICGHSTDRCDFVKDASGYPMEECPEHPGYKVELQAVTNGSGSDRKQRYRCALARAEKKHWCGQRTATTSTGGEKDLPLKPLDKNVTRKSDTQSQPRKTSTKSRSSHEHVSSDSVPKTQTEKEARRSGERAKTSSKIEHKSQLKNKQMEKLLKTGESLHNESFESLAAKAKSQLLTDEAGGSTSHLNDSHRTYRNTGVQQGSSSDSESESDEGDSVTARSNGHNDRNYRNTSVVSISSDDDSEDESSRDRKRKDTSPKHEERPSQQTDVPVKSSSQLQRKPPPEENQVKKLLQNGSFDRNPQQKDAIQAALNAGSTVELVTRQDGTKVIKIIKKTSPEADPTSKQHPQVKSSTQACGSVTSSAAGTSLLSGSAANGGDDLLKIVRQKNDLIRIVNHQKSVSQKMNMDTLPDKGAKLKGQITSLTHQIAQLDIKINASQKELATHQGDGSGAKPKVVVIPSSQVQRNAAGQIVPSGVRQTKITDHVSANLPSHVLQQMYAANPQMNTMYGGRMTEARLREVGSVTSEAIERLHKQLEKMPEPESEVDDPEGLVVPLMVHQRQALKWLSWREKQHPPGGILADDMGLGKTLTMISLVLMQKLAKEATKSDKTKAAEDEWLSKSGKNLFKSSATLIICPASLVHQWDREIQRRCEPGLLSVVMYHGPNREKDLLKLAKADIVLTTYNLISREVGVPEDMKKNKQKQDMAVTDQEPGEGEAAHGLLTIAWERIILDEAHSIKNHKSLTAMSVCRLRALYRWALTGTPIQNDLLDMYSLLRFLRCSPFDEYKLWKRQVDNKSAKGTQRLNMLVKTLLLRRTKDQTTKSGKRLVSLPDRTTTTHEMVLKAGEQAVYNRIYEQSRATLQNYLKRHEEKEQVKQGGKTPGENPWAKDDVISGSANKNPGFTQASQVSAGTANQQQSGGGQILLLLLRLRQCCSHLSLMKDALDVEEMQTDGLDLNIVEQMQDLALKETSDPKEPEVKNVNLFDIDSTSSKIDALLEELRQIRRDSDKQNPMKSVVVSQWTKMLEVVEHHLKAEGIRCCTIKGNVLPKQRAELVDAFNLDPNGPTVMLVSLRAGGVGLNLIGGNHLFLIDMHWNPALEQQACDRVYRVGQQRNVRIHRFICKETVEEKILALQQKKLTLAKDVLSGAGASSNKLTLADLRMLFDLDRPVAMPTNFSAANVVHTTQFNKT